MNRVTYRLVNQKGEPTDVVGYSAECTAKAHELGLQPNGEREAIALRKLAAYEDTGIEPDEVAEYAAKKGTAHSIPLTRDIESMLISAERYALGRRTYIVSDTIRVLIELLPQLSDWCLDALAKDMRSQLALEQRRENPDVWGDACDRQEWYRLIAAIDAQRGLRAKE